MKKLSLFFLIFCILCLNFSCSNTSQKGGPTESGSKYLEHIKQVTESLTNVKEIFSNSSAFAALKNDGSVVTWGKTEYGGDSSTVTFLLSSGVVNIFSNRMAFAAVKSDGSVVTWGSKGYGGDSSTVADKLSSGVVRIFSTDEAFAALKNDGSVVTWGSSTHGGNSSKIADKLSSGVINIVSDEITDFSKDITENDKNGFALSAPSNCNAVDYGAAFVALKSDNTLVPWGNISTNEPLTDFIDVTYNGSSFLALKSDGTVIFMDREKTQKSYQKNLNKLSPKLKDKKIIKIYPDYNKFMLEASDGSIFSSSGLLLSSNMKKIVFLHSMESVIINKDGSVVVPSNYNLKESMPQLDNVANIFSTDQAFAALKSDGSVVTWGDPSCGGDSSSVADKLRSGVVNIFSTDRAFAAVKEDGTVVTWGKQYSGGDSSNLYLGTISIPVDTPLTNIKKIYSSRHAFVALKNDGTVVSWGEY